MHFIKWHINKEEFVDILYRIIDFSTREIPFGKTNYSPTLRFLC